jgi:hypothetical protein
MQKPTHRLPFLYTQVMTNMYFKKVAKGRLKMRKFLHSRNRTMTTAYHI